MKGSIRKLNLEGYECLLYLPPSYESDARRYPVIYMNGGENIPELIADLEPRFVSDCREFLLLNITPRDWKNDYSPWSAPPVMGGEGSFGGGAPAYLSRLTDKVKPYLDSNYRTMPDPAGTAMIGYSLGGLTALYSLYVTGSFGKIGCISGSLWFNRWMEYMNSHAPLNRDAKVYLSLGNGESRSRNQTLARVADCTSEAAEILSRGLNSPENRILEWNHGGHFTGIPQRCRKAILWLMTRLHCETGGTE